MKGLETLFRTKNVEFFLLLNEHGKVRVAARSSGIGVQHGGELTREWVRSGYFVKRGTMHGERYVCTEQGLKVISVLGNVRWLSVAEGRERDPAMPSGPPDDAIHANGGMQDGA
jgi:hypothetical protein